MEDETTQTHATHTDASHELHSDGPHDSQISSNQEPTSAKKTKSFWRGFSEIGRFGVTAVAIVLVIRIFIAQPFIVSGDSMVPTFQNTNYLIVDELSYHFKDPARGDVIIFHPPPDPSFYYIKRIIGLPGDTVTVNNGVVTITNDANPKGIVLTEPYITKDTLNEFSKTVVSAGEYFVMGDNRPASFDSRRWGLLPRKNITGRAFLRLFPLNELNVFPGQGVHY